MLILNKFGYILRIDVAIHAKRKCLSFILTIKVVYSLEYSQKTILIRMTIICRWEY